MYAITHAPTALILNLTILPTAIRVQIVRTWLAVWYFASRRSSRG